MKHLTTGMFAAALVAAFSFADRTIAAPAAADGGNWGEAEFVFVGKLDAVRHGPVGMSMPPMYSDTLSFTVEKAIRGGLKAGQKIDFAHVARQEKPPEYPEGQSCLVAGETTFSGRMIKRIEAADDARVEAATTACLLPIGWSMINGRVVSPWAAMGPFARPVTASTETNVLRDVSGRPALFCGDGVSLSVTPEPPRKSIQWTNPDGDGEYRIVVSNKTTKTTSVPALLTSGGEVLWANSVLVLCQGKTYVLPGYRRDIAAPAPLTLQPGQSVSGVVNPLALEGPEWPRGGYRIGFQFCLGEKSVSHEFYYMSNHHDAVRKALKAAAGEITWDEMKAIILNGKVLDVGQTHSRSVTVRMEDGKTYRATEPTIDEVFRFMRENGKANVPMATE